MPAIAAITLTDNSASDHVFNPQKIEKNVAFYKETAGGVPAGFSTLSICQTEPSSGGSVYRVKLQLAVPKIDGVTVTGGSVSQVDVIRTSRCNVEFLLPIQSELAEREDLLAMVRDLLSESVIDSVVEQLENIY